MTHPTKAIYSDRDVTLGEWVRKSDTEFTATEDEIREMGELLDES